MYLQIFVNDTGAVYIRTYKTTCAQHDKSCGWGKARVIDYITQSEVSYDNYHFKDNHVADMVGVYEGRRQTYTFFNYGTATDIQLYNKGLFKFSSKLLEKLKSFIGDPVKTLEFLNPEKFLTSTDRLNILREFRTNKMRKTENDTLFKNSLKPKNIILNYLEEFKIITPNPFLYNTYINLWLKNTNFLLITSLKKKS